MKRKTVIAKVLFVAAILLFGAFVTVPLLQSIKRDSKNLEAQYLKVFKASLAETDAAEFLRISKIQAQDFEKVNNLFVDAETPVDFIKFLEEIAATSNLEVKITPGTPKKEKEALWPVMEFELASSGRYSEFMRFLEKLENGPYLVRVKNTLLTRERTSLEEENLLQDMNFTLLLEVVTTPLPERTEL
jgi:hypothetical protein